MSKDTVYVLVPKSALDWLNGEGPDANGHWFGDAPDDAPAARAFWWRTKFSAMLSARPTPPDLEYAELEVVAWEVSFQGQPLISNLPVVAEQYREDGQPVEPLVRRSEAATAISTLQAENERLVGERDEALARWEQADGMDGAVVHAIREVLYAAEVPKCAFIDDHVHNAIVQRNALQTRLDAALEALAELVDTLTPAEHASGRDPAYGDMVRALGAQIGFGALMSSASTEWRLWLEENGYPLGGEFVSGPCRSVLQSDLRAACQIIDQEGGKS